ncbi:ankyrin repeat domain-containing protein 6-like [Ruditapes philippinarum]|uniref:ankyrin repeat domain-containing protein 6-like n=1 Tax=Ruditapes philippinarum TaxID=129788 RepID=UPI00295A8C06|nr:ankyrin repeat domain-containing protein 6-like [Ruditapes philippinarum]
MFGQTPLHIAARKNQKTLELIFSEFGEDLQQPGLLLCDEYGNTFLHTLINSHFSREEFQGEKIDISLLKSILENKYKNCPPETRKAILESKNRVGNTPLHLVFQDCLDSEYARTVFELFLKAGTNINSRNSLGETVLHFLMVVYWSYHELAKIAVKRGSKVNVRSIFGESEIFIVPLHDLPYTESTISDTDYLQFLKVSGSDTNTCNRIGQTAVMLHFKDIFFNLNSLNKVFDNKMIIVNRNNFWEYFITTNIAGKARDTPRAIINTCTS